MQINHEKINILQITDTHLFNDDKKERLGVNTNLNFYKVIEQIKKLKSMQPSFFILTGDISEDESEESYIKVVKKLEEINVNVYWIPGNHDNIQIMESVFNKSKLFFRLKRLSLQYWDLIFLNTKLERSHFGYLSDDELLMFEKELMQVENNKNIAIVMHHHPIKVNTPLIDEYLLKNADQFFNIINRNKSKKIKLIICGHVHGDYAFNYNDIAIECAPATCFQWKKGAIDLEIVKCHGFKGYQLKKNNYIQFVKLWSGVKCNAVF